MDTTEASSLNFHKPNINDITRLKTVFAEYKEQTYSCEATPVTIFLWHELYNEEIAFLDDMFFMSFGGENEKIFLLPFAKDMKRAIDLLSIHTEKQNIPLVLFAPKSERLERFKAAFGSCFEFAKSREDFEYIYNSSDLATLKGKKYHSKRNHISTFKKNYNYSFESLNETNLNDFFLLADLWLKEALPEAEDKKGLLEENAAIKRVLPLRKELGIEGGIIKINNSPVAFTFGSPINSNVFDIHVEKALSSYRTAYSVINYEFAKTLSLRYKYINREEDMGIEGLRKAKLSYKPEFLLEKFVITKKG